MISLILGGHEKYQKQKNFVYTLTFFSTKNFTKMYNLNDNLLL